MTAINLRVQGAHLAQGTTRPWHYLFIGLKCSTKMMYSHNALQRLVHRSKPESTGEEKSKHMSFWDQQNNDKWG